MSDHNPDGNPNRSAADRAREDRRLFPLRTVTWDNAMHAARDARQARADAAAGDAVFLAHELSGNVVAHICTPVDEPVERWSVRGQVRCREHFASPHPGDFPGGLPLPPRD